MNPYLVGVPAVLLAAGFVLFAALWFGEREKRQQLQRLLNQSINNASEFEERYNALLAENLSRARAIENATLQRQGIAIPQNLKPPEQEEKPKREHRVVGGSNRLRRHFDQVPQAVEPIRTVGPSSKKVN